MSFVARLLTVNYYVFYDVFLTFNSPTWEKMGVIDNSESEHGAKIALDAFLNFAKMYFLTVTLHRLESSMEKGHERSEGFES